MYAYPTSCTVKVHVSTRKVCYQIESFNPKNRRELATLNTITPFTNNTRKKTNE